MTGRINKSRSVTVRGATLSYTMEGAGIPLLVIGSSIYYPRTFSQKLRQDCLLVCADLPHFVPLGPEYQHEFINFDSYAQSIEAIRIAAGLKRVVVIGHSHHGNVALEYAKRYPQCVSHVVMVGSPPVNVTQTIKEAEQYWAAQATDERKRILQRRRDAVDERRLASLTSTDAYIARYVTDAPLYWNNPDYDAEWLWRDMTFSMDAILAFRDLYRNYQLDWDSRALDIPLLVVMGEQDYAVPHTLWETVLPKLENASFRLLRHSGHTPQLEQPDAFDRILLGWIQNERSAPVSW